MKAAIDPLLIAYEHQTGVSAQLWRDGPITAGCAEDSARARQSFRFAVPAAGDTHGKVIDDALHTMIDFTFEVPLDLREHYAGETITYTANEGSSFHEVTEFWRDGYTLTLIVHAAAGEEPHEVVLVVDAYSTCV